MKKIVFLAAVAILAAISCSKNVNEADAFHPEEYSSAPEWLLDREKPVPIEFGLGEVVSTKADMTIEEEGLFRNASFRYGVVAIDDLGAAHSQVNGIAARNVPTSLLEDGVEGRLRTEFVDGECYYPVSSERGYTFYGYRTDNTNASFGLTADYKKENIAVGPADIIWAKAQAAWGTGFNAEYIRTLMNMQNYSYFYLVNNNAPKFNFRHLTSRFSFFIKAENAYAETTMLDLVYVTDITLKRVKVAATLDVPTGTLTPSGAASSVSVNRDGYSAADYTTGLNPKAAGELFGDPVFLLPSAIDSPEDGILMEMTVHSPDNPAYVYKQVLKYNGEADNFLAGTSYRFIITIKSYETIEINSTVQDWTDVEGDDFVIG